MDKLNADKKFWVGDDDDIALFIAEKYCQLINLDALFFDSPERLFEMIVATNMGILGIPEVILLDLNMWTIEGEQILTAPFFVQFVEEHTIALFVISASGDKQDRERIESLPYVHSFLSKPLTIGLLKNLSSLIL